MAYGLSNGHVGPMTSRDPKGAVTQYGRLS